MIGAGRVGSARKIGALLYSGAFFFCSKMIMCAHGGHKQWCADKRQRGVWSKIDLGTYKRHSIMLSFNLRIESLLHTRECGIDLA